MSDVKLVIGIPHMGTLKAPTALSLVGLLGQTPHPIMVAMHEGPFVQENRTKLVEAALKAEATHLFFLDSDIRCPDDTLVRLLAAEKAIVGGMYNTRQVPTFNTVKMPVETPGEDLPTALFPCHAMGLGCVLIRMEVFRAIQARGEPWFRVVDTDGIVTTGEDVWFCERAHAAGYEVWCEPSISISHIGDHGY